MTDLAASWSFLREEVDTRSRRLASDVADAWSHVQGITQALRDYVHGPNPVQSESISIECLERIFGASAERLLFEPLLTYRKRRPLFSVVSAIQEYEAGLGDVVRQLPLTCNFSGHDVVTQLGGGSGTSLHRYWLMWRRSVKNVALRALVSGHVQRMILRRGVIDGAIQLSLARSCLHLLIPWQAYREHALRRLSGEHVQTSLEDAWRRWDVTSEEQGRRFTRLLETYATWAGSATDQLAAAMVRSRSVPSKRASTRRSELQRQRMSHWSRQQRAVQAVLDLEVALAQLAGDITKEGGVTLESAQSEHDQLLRELDLAIGALESWSLAEGEFPPAQVRLISAEEYVKDCCRRSLLHARSRLPITVEVIDPDRALPGARGSWRDVEPVKHFSVALENKGTPQLTAGFREVVASHQLVMREIERAREVVSFGKETARSEGPTGEVVARESVQNALSLLLYQKRITPEIRPTAQASLVQAQALVLLECQAAIEKGRIGWLAHLTRQRGMEAVAQARVALLAGLGRASRRAWLVMRSLSEEALIKIGWLAPPRPQLPAMIQRSHLGQVLDLQAAASDLPMIYRRLFRLTPVEELRFLVGREREMAGLGEAMARWNCGAPAAVIVVGARGSGKTRRSFS